MAEYKNANAELIALIYGKNFNSARAEEIISEIEDLNTPVYVKGYLSTYLYEAEEVSNIAAVEFFLSHGADPNLYNVELDVSNGLWDIQWATVTYPTEEHVQLRYEIAKLYFKYGANPNIAPDGESLYYYVAYKVFEDSEGREFEILLNLYKLLIIYGGGSKEHAIDTSIIDYSRVDGYRVDVVFKEDGTRWYGGLIDPDGNVIDTL